MIDVLKRLAELDAKNPQIVKESSSVAECGPMGMMGMGMPEPKTPATLNITADSGEELGSMLAAIMQLAGVQKVEPEQLGVEHEPSLMTAEPAMGSPSSDGEDMRSVIDKLNPDDEEGEDDDQEETDEGQYDNSPTDPRDAPSFNANQFSQNSNDGDGDTASGQRRTTSQPTATFESLMKDYKAFIGESAEEDDEEVEEGMMDKAKAFGKKVLDKVGHGDDEDMIKDLQKKAGVPQTGKKPEPK